MIDRTIPCSRHLYSKQAILRASHMHSHMQNRRNLCVARWNQSTAHCTAPACQSTESRDCHARRRQAGRQVSMPPLSVAAGPTKAVSRFGSAVKSVARRAATPHGGRCHASPGEHAATLLLPIHSSGGPFRHFSRRGGPFCQKLRGRWLDDW